MNLSVAAASEWTWPEAFLVIGLSFLGFLLLGATIATWLETRKLKVASHQDEDLRQLVRRYEQLAENTVDTQQRVAADVSELRSRTNAIEQILRTVE
jgi:ABC-type phosphate transport system auxiliary subunit